MSNFKAAYEYLMKDEGKIFENVPSDPGGATAFGLTHTDISRYLGRPVTIDEMKAMNDELAMKIYQFLYWKPLGLDGVINDNVALVIFNQCVLRGIGFMKQIQAMVGATPDGVVGPKTLAAINSFAPGKLIEMIEQNGERFYTSLAANKPSLRKFLRGWMNRTKRLLNFR